MSWSCLHSTIYKRNEHSPKSLNKQFYDTFFGMISWLAKHLLLMLIYTLIQVTSCKLHLPHGPYALLLHSKLQIPTSNYNTKLILMDFKILEFQCIHPRIISQKTPQDTLLSMSKDMQFWHACSCMSKLTCNGMGFHDQKPNNTWKQQKIKWLGKYFLPSNFHWSSINSHKCIKKPIIRLK
jgi:hypothetical protein